MTSGAKLERLSKYSEKAKSAQVSPLLAKKSDLEALRIEVNLGKYLRRFGMNTSVFVFS